MFDPSGTETLVLGTEHRGSKSGVRIVRHPKPAKGDYQA